MVAAMAEEAANVPGGNRRKRCLHAFDQGAAGTRLGPPQQPLELGERLPYGLRARIRVQSRTHVPDEIGTQVP
jgi:hypothetical protein